MWQVLMEFLICLAYVWILQMQPEQFRQHSLCCFKVFNNHVGRTWLLGLHRKQNGCLVEHIACWMFISPPPLHGLQHLWSLTYSPVTIAKLAGLLMGIKDTSKLRNWRVAKSRIVLILVNTSFHNSSVMVVGTSLWITPTSCAYSLVAPFG